MSKIRMYKFWNDNGHTKEVIEVDNKFLKMIDINMKNAINKIINNYKLNN